MRRFLLSRRPEYFEQLISPRTSMPLPLLATSAACNMLSTDPGISPSREHGSSDAGLRRRPTIDSQDEDQQL